MSEKKIIRSEATTKIAGVCGAIADYFGVDPTLVRIIYVVLSVFTAAFPGVLLYLLLMLIIPKE